MQFVLEIRKVHNICFYSEIDPKFRIEDITGFKKLNRRNLVPEIATMLHCSCIESGVAALRKAVAAVLQEHGDQYCYS